MPKEATLPHKRLLQMDDDLKKRIDDFRYRERFPSEAAAIRALIGRGLAASAPKPKAKR
jgi:hypothetical protein